MADETSENGETKTPRTVQKIDFSRPVYIVFDQTQSKNNIEFFQGPDAVKKATDLATERAGSLGRDVLVIGPQIVHASPPEKPQVVVNEVSFDDE